MSTDVAPAAEALGTPPQARVPARKDSATLRVASGATAPNSTSAGLNLLRTTAPAAALPVTAASPITSAAVAVPSRPARRFQEWRRRYCGVVVLVDALVGLLSVIAATTFYGPTTHFAPDKALVLVLGAALAWPVAVAVCHGYDQRKIGLGDDEFRTVLHAMVLAIAAAAVPSAVVDKYGVVALSVVAIPAAGAASLLVRVVGRRHLRRQQRLGRNVRRLVLVGSAGTVAELIDVLGREQHGMKVLGVCVPQAERERAENSGLRVLGSLDDAAAVVRASGADSVAVTSGEATRHLYLKRLAWALEGADVELLVHPGLVEVAGPRMHIRPHVGPAAAARRAAALHRLAAVRQAGLRHLG